MTPGPHVTCSGDALWTRRCVSVPCSLPVSRLTTEHPTIPEGKLRPDIGRGNWSSMSGFQGRRGAGVLWGLFGIGIPTRLNPAIYDMLITPSTSPGWFHSLWIVISPVSPVNLAYANPSCYSAVSSSSQSSFSSSSSLQFTEFLIGNWHCAIFLHH